jgi:superfamily II DNA or RNA helicase
VVGEAPEVETLPIDKLRRPNSYIGYRAWVPNDGFGFRAALIERHDGENFTLHMSNGAQEVRPPRSVVIRQDEPFTDVLKAVQKGAVDDPTLYLARREFLTELILQGAACRGYDSALSAAIDLYDHQLETLQRVLEDPVPRFVLADEVGLGKTIEAALIIRQTLLDDASAHVYISTPSALEQQWRSELAYKFFLGKLLESQHQFYPQILIRPHEELIKRPEEAQGARFLVIDEAHQLIQRSLSQGRWHILTEVAHGAQGLLLLSATPMRGDYGILEALLHLVDPVAFPLGQQQRFAERVEERTVELVDIDVLTSPFSTTTDQAAAVKRIRDRHSDDAYVAKITDPASPEIPLAVDAANELGNYLRETYRISRRMIRHRRGAGPAADFPTAGRRAVILPVRNDQVQVMIDDFLETYRLRLQALPRSSAVPVFWQAVSHGLAGRGPLVEFISSRLEALSRSDPSPDTGSERSLLEWTRAQLLLAPDMHCQVAVDEACRRVKAGQRIVAISEYQSQAENFAHLAKDRLGDARKVLTHLSTTPAREREWMLDEFLRKTGTLLVGDHSLEEGRNLQGSHALLNLDLPLSPNRLEQRIGRVDRYTGASIFGGVDSVPDIVVLDAEDSTWSAAHVLLLDQGIGVLTESVSTVQRLLASWETRLRENLLDEGVAALSQDLANLRSKIENEKLEVDELEEWESDSSSDYSHMLTTEALAAYEDRTWKLESALARLTSEAGGLPFEVERAGPGDSFRFNLRRTPTYLVPPGLGLRVEELVGRRYSIHRLSSVTTSYVMPLRIGDPLVDWLREYLLTDERGRAFAATAVDVSVGAWDFWVRFDYLVEFDDHALELVSERDRRRLRRRGDAFLAPCLFGLWGNADMVADPELSRHLDLLLGSATSGRREYVDWRTVHEEIRGWSVECESAERTARAWVMSSHEFHEAVEGGLKSVVADQSRREAILKARARRLPSPDEREAALRDLNHERTLSRCIRRGIAEPNVSLVSCGALLRMPG